MNKVNQSDLVNILYTVSGKKESKKTIHSFISDFFEYIFAQTLKLNRVEIRGFGIFMLKTHNRITLYNPIINKMTKSKPYHVLYFKPSCIITNKLIY